MLPVTIPYHSFLPQASRYIYKIAGAGVACSPFFYAASRKKAAIHATNVLNTSRAILHFARVLV
jgi:hypothetical protein